MDEKDNTAVDVRKLQEAQENILKAGLHLEVAKWHWSLYSAYIKAGFSAGQALELVKANINQ